MVLVPRDELAVFEAELVPKGMKVFVVGVMNNVAKLMQHDISYYFYGVELSFVIERTQTKIDSLTLPIISAEEKLLGGPKFRQGADFPSSPSHNGFH